MKSSFKSILFLAVFTALVPIYARDCNDANSCDPERVLLQAISDVRLWTAKHRSSLVAGIKHYRDTNFHSPRMYSLMYKLDRVTCLERLFASQEAYQNIMSSAKTDKALKDQLEALFVPLHNALAKVNFNAYEWHEMSAQKKVLGDWTYYPEVRTILKKMQTIAQEIIEKNAAVDHVQIQGTNDESVCDGNCAPYDW